MSISFEKGDKVDVLERGTGVVQEIKKGWYVIKLDDNKELVNCRAASLTPIGNQGKVPDLDSSGDENVGTGEEIDPSEDQPTAAKGSVISKESKASYETYKKGKTTSMDCADKTAKSLRDMELDEVYNYAASVLELPKAELEAKYSRLNPGMQRMNLGNRIRTLLTAASSGK